MAIPSMRATSALCDVRTWASLSLLFYAAVACTDAGGPATPMPEPHAAILTIQDAPQRIVRADATGRDTVTVLTESSVTYSGLRPSPDGSVILFNRCLPGCTLPGSLYRISPTGQGMSAQPGPALDPRWAPDGTRIGWPAGGTMILTDPDGNSPDTVGLAEDFAWSPDGTKLAITYRPTNTDEEVGLIDLLGNRSRLDLTNSPYDDRSPAWSPDGTHIAFYSARASAPGVYVMNADGTGQHLLVAAEISSPVSWSPDGIHIAFVDFADSIPRLRVFTPEGAEMLVPTQLSRQVRNFSWSPSGAHALFIASNSAGPPQAYLTTVDFKNYQQLKSGPLGVSDVAWLHVP